MEPAQRQFTVTIYTPQHLDRLDRRTPSHIGHIVSSHFCLIKPCRILPSTAVADAKPSHESRLAFVNSRGPFLYFSSSFIQTDSVGFFSLSRRLVGLAAAAAAVFAKSYVSYIRIRLVSRGPRSLVVSPSLHVAAHTQTHRHSLPFSPALPLPSSSLFGTASLSGTRRGLGTLVVKPGSVSIA